MFSAILIILALTMSDIAKLRGMQFKPLSKVVFFVFAANLLFLMGLGAKHVDDPYIGLGQFATIAYFLYYFAPMPLGNYVELTLGKLYVSLKGKLDILQNTFQDSLDSTVATLPKPHSFRYLSFI